MKFVDNPKQVLFKYWSIKAKALGVAIPISWAVLPEAWQKAYFPDWIPQSMAYVTGAFLFVSLLCQFIKQDLPEPDAIQGDGHIKMIKDVLKPDIPKPK